MRLIHGTIGYNCVMRDLTVVNYDFHVIFYLQANALPDVSRELGKVDSPQNSPSGRGVDDSGDTEEQGRRRSRRHKGNRKRVLSCFLFVKLFMFLICRFLLEGRKANKPGGTPRSSSTNFNE